MLVTWTFLSLWRLGLFDNMPEKKFNRNIRILFIIEGTAYLCALYFALFCTAASNR
jgi:hypothetical protein